MAGMSNTSVKKNPLEQMKETRCIYIPGQPIKNVTPGCDYKIVLGSVREVETFAKKPFPRQPKPKHRFSSIYAPNYS